MYIGTYVYIFFIYRYYKLWSHRKISNPFQSLLPVHISLAPHQHVDPPDPRTRSEQLLYEDLAQEAGTSGHEDRFVAEELLYALHDAANLTKRCVGVFSYLSLVSRGSRARGDGEQWMFCIFWALDDLSEEVRRNFWDRGGYGAGKFAPVGYATRCATKESACRIDNQVIKERFEDFQLLK